MYSVHDTYLMVSGFPHSDIFGSKSGCRLPEAFRRLQRPSSPLAAKASTVCAYSLDHIIQSLTARLRSRDIKLRHCARLSSLCLSFFRRICSALEHYSCFGTFSLSTLLKSIRIVKTRSKISVLIRQLAYEQKACFDFPRQRIAYTLNKWWSQTGSNR